MLADFFQLALEEGDALADAAPIDFELRLARPAQADAAGATASRRAARLARQVRPLPGEPRQAIFVLRQLDLQRAFFGVRVLGEDVQDERCAVEYPHGVAENFLQIALMARR
jgi:hypothetical protein